MKFVFVDECNELLTLVLCAVSIAIVIEICWICDAIFRFLIMFGSLKRFTAGCCTSCAVRIKNGQIRQPEALGISAELKDKARVTHLYSMFMIFFFNYTLELVISTC